MPRWNVLIVIDSLAVGGAERCAVDMACALDRTRFQPHVLVTRHSGPLAATLERAGVEYTVLGRRRRIGLRAARTAREWLRWADVVHAHKLSSGAWCSLLAPRMHTPLLVHEHNWSGRSTIVPRLVYRLLLRWRAHRTICVSGSVADTVAAYGVPRERIVTLPNAVLTGAASERRTARAALDLDPTAPVIGMVAGLRPEKAHDLALDALADPRLAALGARLCVVGAGPCSDVLHARARELGIDHRIDWRSAVPDQPARDGDLPRSAGAALSSAFDVALICSDWEGLPLFALEAMAAGTPLVATAVGELPHVCRLDAGLVVPPRDAVALAGALAQSLTDRDAAQRRARRALDRIEGEHSFDALTRTLEATYADALGHDGAAPTSTDIARERSA